MGVVLLAWNGTMEGGYLSDSSERKLQALQEHSVEGVEI